MTDPPSRGHGTPDGAAPEPVPGPAGAPEPSPGVAGTPQVPPEPAPPPTASPGGRWARTRERAARLAETARASPEQVPMVGRTVGHLLRVNLLDNATRLAAQTFLSALPALFVVAVFAPATVRDGVASSLRDHLGLQGATEQQVHQLLNTREDGTTQSFGVLGAVVTLLSATALSRALQRVCERCWELPKSRTRVAVWRWLVWLAVWLVFLVFEVPIRKGFGLGPLLGVPLAFLAGTALWWWTQHLLLGNRVRWYPLLPGAVFAGATELLIGVASQVYLPGAVSRSVQKFGPYGVVFTSLSWLIVLFAGITLALVLGRVIAEEPAVARLLGSPTEPGEWGRPRRPRRPGRPGNAVGGGTGGPRNA
ncbi:YhjD/YihY/BrkB family envelope integrity protein [Kitasatospora sp. NPDC094015]|uniref:YhjD/YihY/BrkB family envelope integrity protein n=1 Tax=Kitasatospora sp. NPDC094015 TaxID=3155205 RepID=UPI0033203F8B